MSSNTLLNKGSKLKAVLTITMIVSCAYATTVAPAAAFEGRDRGNSGYRHGGFGSRGNGDRGAYGFNRGNPYRHGGYGRGYNSGYRNGYGNNGYGYNSGGGGIIGGLLGGE